NSQKAAIIVGDGGIGTEIMKMDSRGNQAPFSYNLSNPELVTKIHQNYLEAGSDIITTNTFSANRLYLKQDKKSAGLTENQLMDKITRLNQSGAELAVTARDKFINENPGQSPILVAGSVGPTGSEEAIFPNQANNHKKLVATFQEQIEALAAGGVDLILLETFSYHLELSAGLEALKEFELPAIVNMSFDSYTNTNYGTDINDFAGLINNYPANKILAAGFNCITPEPGYQKTLNDFINSVNLPLSIYYNAGKPELNLKTGQTIYKSRDDFFTEIKKILQLKGPDTLIIGGCCGTEPGTIEKIHKLI
ncbi:MAG: homocysteine S-methyltransferase family protein, partial [Bacillota bacterium]